MPARRRCGTVSVMREGSSKSGRNELVLRQDRPQEAGVRRHAEIQKRRNGMADKLKHTRVAIIATEGFEGAELREPRRALDAEGAETKLLSPKTGEIKA